MLRLDGDNGDCVPCLGLLLTYVLRGGVTSAISRYHCVALLRTIRTNNY